MTLLAIEANAEPFKWLGETVGFWVQTFILAVSAVAAIWVIRASKNQEKRRATIDVVMDQKRDSALLLAREAMHHLHESGATNLAKHLENPASNEYKALLLVLNTYEFVACGIRTGAFDENTYKRLRYSNVTKDWDALHGFVSEFRRQKQIPTLFQDYEWLRNRWRKKPLKQNS